MIFNLLKRSLAVGLLATLVAALVPTAGRADALLFLEFRGRASENLTTTPFVPQVANGANAPNRGRY